MQSNNSKPLLELGALLAQIDLRLSRIEAVTARLAAKTQTHFLEKDITEIKQLADKSFHKRFPKLNASLDIDDILKYLHSAGRG